MRSGLGQLIELNWQFSNSAPKIVEKTEFWGLKLSLDVLIYDKFKDGVEALRHVRIWGQRGLQLLSGNQV